MKGADRPLIICWLIRSALMQPQGHMWCRQSCAHSGNPFQKVCTLCVQGTTAFIASAWATHAASCRAHGLGLFQPSKSLFLAGAVTLWGTRLAGYLFYRVLKTGKDSRLSFLFPKDEKEPFLTGQSKWVTRPLSPSDWHILMTACWLLVGLQFMRNFACICRWHQEHKEAACFTAALPCRYPLKLAGFWSAQSLWGWIVLLPVTVSQVRMYSMPAATPMRACTHTISFEGVIDEELPQVLADSVLERYWWSLREIS